MVYTHFLYSKIKYKFGLIKVSTTVKTLKSNSLVPWGFLGQGFKNLCPAGCTFDVIAVQYMIKSFPNLVNSSWLWWIMCVVLTNQKQLGKCFEWITIITINLQSLFNVTYLPAIWIQVKSRLHSTLQICLSCCFALLQHCQKLPV